MNDNPSMTLLEKFLLLAIDSRTKQMYPLKPDVLSRAIAGAVLMDLALKNRIDNDLKDMFTVDPTPTGDDILDPALQTMAQAPVLMPHPTTHWLKSFCEESDALRDKALRRLEQRGLLRRNSGGILWMFGLNRTPDADIRKINEIKSEILGALYNNKVPALHDILLIGLMESSGLTEYLLNATELKDTAARIAEIARMDLISQAIAKGFPDEPPKLVAAS